MGQSTQTSAKGVASTLSTVDILTITVGVVIGVGVFKTPALVAANTSGGTGMLLAWMLGGGVSVVGALCYAELASAYPDAGGDYYYFQRAYGDWVAFVFAWARLVVIQTGSITLIAFVFGDYASELWSLGPFSSSLYAAVAVCGLTGLNVYGVRQGTGVQHGLTLATVGGLILLTITGFFVGPGPEGGMPEVQSASDGGGQFGMAMVFVLLTFGGWNEAAYLSGEAKNPERTMAWGLLGSIGVITGLYLLVNAAYLYGLGLEGMGESEVIAAALMEKAFGDPGAYLLSGLVVAAALSSTNATIFTGARSGYALGRDFELFGFLGEWDESRETPVNALLVQGAIALALVGFGAWTRKGFESMVDYTAPVFWLFFGLAGASLIVLRATDSEVRRPFRVPLYPYVPVAFCAACGYMLWSSLAYTGAGALLGVGVLGAGIAAYLIESGD
ncbi:APC family permease [Salinibacter ruber]|jgi:APA family basic amino acid/polyamine antiporter|uniref:APC family permease n=1 Tax=Salinibacter ruber TaxID=146919 RepID=UPI0024342A39|nr:APC family permease [Salinibacter ruber]